MNRIISLLVAIDRYHKPAGTVLRWFRVIIPRAFIENKNVRANVSYTGPINHYYAVTTFDHVTCSQVHDTM